MALIALVIVDRENRRRNIIIKHINYKYTEQHRWTMITVAHIRVTHRIAYGTRRYLLYISYNQHNIMFAVCKKKKNTPIIKLFSTL